MSLKRASVVVLQVLALTVGLLICFVIAAQLSGLSRSQRLVQPTPAAPAPGGASSGAVPGERPPAERGQEMQRAQAEQAVAFFKPMSTFALLVSAAFAWMLLRSGWIGWPLAAATFLACFGLGTVVAQIESAIYLPAKMPPGMLRSIILTGLYQSLLFAPLAVLLLGKATGTRKGSIYLRFSAGAWAARLVLLAAVFVALYYLFGYYVAWKVPAVQGYYGGTDPGNIFKQLSRIWQSQPWMFLIQFGRGLLWTLFVLPLVRSFQGGRLELACAVALLFASWSAILLLPNPLMPPAVAHAHLVETAGCDAVLGFVTGWVLGTRHG
jgi:hypothetical protein